MVSVLAADTGRRQEAAAARGQVLVDPAPSAGPAARFAELPLAARLSAGVLLLGAVIFAFQRLRGGGGGCVVSRP